jgi:hypothetical protein
MACTAQVAFTVSRKVLVDKLYKRFLMRLPSVQPAFRATKALIYR